MTYVFLLGRQHASRIMSSQVTKVAAVVPATSFTLSGKRDTVEDYWRLKSTDRFLTHADHYVYKREEF